MRRFERRRAVSLGLVLALVVTSLAVLLPLSVGASESIASGLDATKWRAQGGASASIRVILHGSDAKKLGETAAAHGGRVVRDLRLGGAVAVELPASQVAAVAKAKGVKRVAIDAPVIGHARAEDIFDAARLASAYPWAVTAPQLWGGDRPITGRRIGVAVVDSGIAQDRDFDGPSGSRIVARFATSSNDVKVDRFGHGTAIAGVIGGSGYWNRGAYVGVAPQVDLISLKVGDEAGAAYTSDVVAAIKWAVENRAQYNIRVLNLSLTSTVPESYRTSLLDFAVEYAWASGIVVVVSAGNCASGQPCGTLYPPANDPFVITVGATDDRGTKATADDALADFSVHGTTSDGYVKPDLVAPGRHLITVLSTPNNALVKANPSRVVDNHYIRLSGTSLSTAVVSGVIAQILQARSELRPSEVKWLLARTAQGLGSAGSGAGYPQGHRAIAYSEPLEFADLGIAANRYIALAIAKTLGLKWNGVSWDGVSWDGVSWDGVSWDGVSWDGVSWDGVSWDGVSWDGVSWDGVSWDGVSWDGVSWDALQLD